MAPITAEQSEIAACSDLEPKQRWLKRHNSAALDISFQPANYSGVQKSVPVKLARLLAYIAINYCFDSHPRIDSVLQKPIFRY
jgi:hypothetical protein